MVRLVRVVIAVVAPASCSSSSAGRGRTRARRRPRSDTAGVPGVPPPLAAARTRRRSCAGAVRCPASARSAARGKLAATGRSRAVRPFADVGSRAELREVRGDIRRDFAALNRLLDPGGASTAEVQGRSPRSTPPRSSPPSAPTAGAHFAERYAGRTEGGPEGQGPRLRRRLRLRPPRPRPGRLPPLHPRPPPGRSSPAPPATWTVTLAREDGRWRFVRGPRNVLPNRGRGRRRRP